LYEHNPVDVKRFLKSLFRSNSYVNNADTLTKYDIVNKLGIKYSLSSVLEISSISTGFAHDKINNVIFINKDILYYKPSEFPENYSAINRIDVNIEPQSFEYQLKRIKEKQIQYDIVFVDPWHTYHQSLMDLEAALTLVSDKGFIVIHDCCPISAEEIGAYKQGPWCGQTYEAFVEFSNAHKNLEIFCVDSDYGCGIVSMVPRFSLQRPTFKYEKSKIHDWNYFNAYKTELLNLIEAEKFLELLAD
jgi:hypothetical protein